MSYYGYPNAQAYGANYAQYAAAYAAQQTGTYDQSAYAAAYNAAAYNAMQMPTNGATTGQAKTGIPAGISVSGTPQRYDYTQAIQQPQPQTGTGYDNAAAYASNMVGTSVPQSRPHNGPKWGQLPGQPGAPKINKYGQNGGSGSGGFNNNRARRNPTGAPVQVFYCEVCKISCAGPQTYKEHLDGQKHKKREAAIKINEAQALAVVNGTPVVSEATEGQSGNNSRNGKWKKYPGPQHGRGTNSSNLVIQCALCDVACTGKDAYLAHARGAKHQKTEKLHIKLGKPIPPDALETMEASKLAILNKVISAPPKINISNRPVNSQNPPVESMTQNQATTHVNSNTDNGNEAGNENNHPVETEEDLVNIEPIGKEYIESKLEGKILSFFCKLCECQFNDPNAKDMHTKGRRHRLAYKKKVDPSLKVDMKGNPRDDKKNSRNSRSLERNTENRVNNTRVNNMNKSGSSDLKPLMSNPEDLNGSKNANYNGNSTQNSSQNQPQPLMATQFNQFSNQSGSNYYNRYGIGSFDDKHIISKHNSIYPSEDEINAIQEIVTSTEKALKLVSDQISEEDPENTNKNVGTDGAETNSQNTYRALKGVMRVGLLAKGLLLKGDTDVQLIVLCAEKPTKSLLERVYSILLQKIDIVSPEIKYSIILDKDAETIVIIKTTISDLQPLITCKILLTSPKVRTDSELRAEQEKTPEKAENIPEVEGKDLLQKQKCLDSLASLRHAKWFQARASNVPNCVVIIRVLRDLCNRNTTWAPLTQWGLELLVEKCLSSSSNQLSPGECLRRVLECVSSGVLLAGGGPGLHDPCEKDPTDVSAVLKNQQAEELTSSAQMALRLLAFKQIYKILGMEVITYQGKPENDKTKKMPKKRSNTSNESQVEEKKAKEDNQNDNDINADKNSNNQQA